jgi:TRAP-type mannitol/chloroaromatic compound transport system substrate-binding protein
MDIKMGFHKIAPYYYTGWHEPATDLQFIVNKKAFDSLPAEYKVALKIAMQVAATDMHYENFAMSAEAWATMKTEFPNIKVVTFPEPVFQAMKKATDEVLGEYAAKDPLFKEVLDSQMAFMKKAREWTKISEQYYLQESEKVVK